MIQRGNEMDSLIIITLHLLLSMVLGQSSPSPTPYQVLPLPETYSDGAFFIPNTSYTQVYTEGAVINITWTTSYKAINLYLIKNLSGSNPFTLGSGLADSSFPYAVKCLQDDCTAIYQFRAVDSYGSFADQNSGGFTSGQFWISPSNILSPPGSSMASTSMTSTSMSQAGVVGSTSTNAPTPSSTSRGTDNDTNASSPSSTSHGIDNGTNASTPSLTSHGIDNGTAIGAGVGVGVGVAFILVGGVWYLWRHDRAKKFNPPNMAKPKPPHWGRGGSPGPYDTRFEAPNTNHPSELMSDMPSRELSAEAH